MDSLPVEIFQHIFLSALPYESFLERSMPTREHATNFHIAATCARWRDIALRTPNLWAQIKVHGLCDDHIFQRISLQLERSGTAPLELRLSLDRKDARWSVGSAYSRCIQIVGEHVYHWRRVHIEIPVWMTRENMAMLMTQCSFLEELVLLPVSAVPAGIDYRSDNVISSTADIDGSLKLEPPRYFHNARQLVRLESHATPMVPKHPLERLTFLSISLRDIPDAPLWLTLAMTPNIQELRIYYRIHRSGWSNDPPSVKINLSHLTNMALYGLPDSFEWIDVFNAPKVHTLAVSIEPCPRLVPLFIKLRDTVRHLIITTVDPEYYGGILNVTDAVALDNLFTLDTFELLNLPAFILQSWNNSFFQHLVERARKREGWVARLRRFVINECAFELDACDSLIEFVQAKYEMAGEEQAFVCEVVGGTALLRLAHESDASLETMPQALRDAVTIHEGLSYDWTEEEVPDEEHEGDDGEHQSGPN